MPIGKVVEANATVVKGELSSFIETLERLGVPHSIEPCYLDNYVLATSGTSESKFLPAVGGYKFLPPADGVVVVVQKTRFVFSKGPCFHINAKQFGPSGTLVFVHDQDGRFNLRQHYENGQPTGEQGFHALARQYKIYEEITAFQNTIEAIKQRQLQLESD